MTRLFGYLVSETPQDLRHRLASFATGSVGRIDKFAPGEHQGRSEHAFACGGCEATTSDAVSVALTGRPAWPGAPEDETGRGMADGIGRAYLRSGPDVVAELTGPFAVAIIDHRDLSVHLAIDRLGIERLAYAQLGKGLVFGSSASDVARCPGIDAGLRLQALYDYLFMHMVPSPGTSYDGVLKLPPATVLSYRSGHCSLRRYWQPEPVENRVSFADLKDELFVALENGVSATGLDERTGAFLSGGLDSSTVTGVLSSTSGPAAKTFTVGFGEADYDELRFARLTARHFDCQPFEYHLQPDDIVEAFPQIAAHYDEPFGNSSAVPTLFCARLARQNGVDHLLAGDGGDELFAGNERYARQQVFEFYGRLPTWLRRRFVGPLAAAIDPESRLTPLRKLRSYVDQASIPLPERFESWNFVYREGRSRLLDPEFADAVDVDGPMQHMRDVWNEVETDSLLDRMLHYDWRFTLADNDLRKVGAMCELAGVRVSYPLLHPDVVDLSVRVPPSMKMKRLELRTFFRDATKGYLAEETLRKDKQGFGLPFGVWLKTNERLGDLIYGSLSDLKKRRIVSAAFIDDVIAEHRTGHPSYYGYAIWDLAMLEAWLQAHEY